MDRFQQGINVTVKKRPWIGQEFGARDGRPPDEYFLKLNSKPPDEMISTWRTPEEREL